MVSRRRALALGAAALGGLAGCAGSPPAGSGTDGPPETTGDDGTGGLPDPVADGPTRTPGDDLPEWTPAWTQTLDEMRVLGLDPDGDRLLATLSADGGPAGVAPVDPADGSLGWRAEFDGEAVGASHAAHGPEDGWGVTVGDDALYAVTGNVEDRAWSAVRALGRADGDERWSVRRERRLAVGGVVDGLVVAAATEFGERTTPTGTPPPTDATLWDGTPAPLSTRVLGLDAATGEVRWTRELEDVADVAVGRRSVAVAGGAGLTLLDHDGARRGTYDHGPGEGVAVAGDRVYYRTGEGDTAVLHGVGPGGDVEWRQGLPVRRFVVGGGRLYAAGEGVFALDPDGTVAWRDDDYGRWPFLGPGGETLYARSGTAADAATAYDVGGTERWTVAPPSQNAWPAAATRDAAVVQAITGDSADEPFYTVYAVDGEGRATASRGVDTVFDVVGHEGRVYLADGEGRLSAFDP